jgi:hypothetical protein
MLDEELARMHVREAIQRGLKEQELQRRLGRRRRKPAYGPLLLLLTPLLLLLVLLVIGL